MEEPTPHPEQPSRCPEQQSAGTDACRVLAWRCRLAGAAAKRAALTVCVLCADVRIFFFSTLALARSLSTIAVKSMRVQSGDRRGHVLQAIPWRGALTIARTRPG